MTIDRAELRKRAEEASAGEWHIRHDDEVWIGVKDDEVDRYITGGGFEADSAYIVAAQPSTVLAILDRIEELEAGLTALLAVAPDSLGCGHRCSAEIDGGADRDYSDGLRRARKALSGETK